MNIFSLLGISLLVPFILLMVFIFLTLVGFGFFCLTNRDLIGTKSKATRQAIDRTTHEFLDQVFDPPLVNKEK
jgi:hypothetical protein